MIHLPVQGTVAPSKHYRDGHAQGHYRDREYRQDVFTAQLHDSTPGFLVSVAI